MNERGLCCARRRRCAFPKNGSLVCWLSLLVGTYDSCSCVPRVWFVLQAQAAGFKLSSIRKLTQTKSNDGTTLLSYLIQHFDAKAEEAEAGEGSSFPAAVSSASPRTPVTAGSPTDAPATALELGDLLRLPEDFDKIKTAQRINLQQLSSDVKQFQKGVNMLAKFNEPHSAFDLAIRPYYSDKLAMMKRLEAAEQRALEEFQATAQYLGEKPSDADPEALFKQLSDFVSDFTQTHEKYKEKKAAMARQAAQEAEKERRAALREASKVCIACLCRTADHCCEANTQHNETSRHKTDLVVL